MIEYEEIEKLSQKYNVPVEDVLLIALNRFGITEKETDENRIRFKIKLNTYSEIFYMAVCVNTYDSPFKIENNELLLNNKSVGKIIEREKDTCDTTYFRRNKTEITLNSNARSQCKGCKFCGTYKLESEDINELNTPEKLSRQIECVLKQNNIKDLQNLDRITVCTGCFKDEEELFQHLKMIKTTLAKYGFNKKIGYIGSQIKSIETLEKIKKEIGQFSLIVTTECFENRSELMRSEKSGLSLEKTVELLDGAVERGFETTIIYISGIDKLDTFRNNFKILSKHVNRFPIVQIMQNYTIEQESYRIEEAKNLDYYLNARKILEQIYGETDLKPQGWENYRSLFYTKYNDTDYRDIKI